MLCLGRSSWGSVMRLQSCEGSTGAGGWVSTMAHPYGCWRLQLLHTWATPEGCLRILMTKQWASSRGNDPRHRAEATSLYDLALKVTHYHFLNILWVIQSRICQCGRDHTKAWTQQGRITESSLGHWLPQLIIINMIWQGCFEALEESTT